MNKNFLLLKNGVKLQKTDKIDIWWRGERNGNLMVLLAYIMKTTEHQYGTKIFEIRIIRKLGENEDKDTAYNEMNELMDKGRLSVEVVILPSSNEPFIETAYNISSFADLVMMFLPGNYTIDSGRKYFKLNEFFFNKEIQKYDSLPPIIFVKSAYVLNLIEE